MRLYKKFTVAKKYQTHQVDFQSNHLPPTNQPILKALYIDSQKYLSWVKYHFSNLLMQIEKNRIQIA
jgi:hypothetical protein